MNEWKAAEFLSGNDMPQLFGLKKPSDNTVPVYVLYNPNSGNHYYTADKSEYDSLVSAGWRGQGIAFRAFKA